MKKSSRALNLMFIFYKEHNFDPFHFLMVGDLLASYDFDDNSRKIIDTFIYYAKVKQMSKKALEAVDI